jgi:hypothetical protein
MVSRAWFLALVVVVWAGVVPVQAQGSGLGPWENSSFTIGVEPIMPSSRA